MAENTPKTAWNHRGPLPPYPANVDLVAWLDMESHDRAEHLRQHAEKEGFGEADTDRMVKYWDHLATLLKMDGRERAQQIRCDMEQAWAGFNDEIERQTGRMITFWDELVAAANRRQPHGESAL